MPTNKKKSGGGLVVALTFASLFLNHPQNGLMIVLCVAVSASLLYAFSDYPSRANDSFRRLTRWCFLAFGCVAISSLWGYFWWGRVTVAPEKISFQGYQNETFNLSAHNTKSDDVYDVQIPFFIGYNKHFEDKLSAQTLSIGEPSSFIHIDYNYCFGTKGDGVVSHVQQNEREVLIVRVPHLPPYASANFSITYTGGEKFDAQSEDPTFLDSPPSYSPIQITGEVRGDYRICKYAIHAFRPGPTGESQ